MLKSGKHIHLGVKPRDLFGGCNGALFSNPANCILLPGTPKLLARDPPQTKGNVLRLLQPYSQSTCSLFSIPASIPLLSCSPQYLPIFGLSFIIAVYVS